MQFVTIICTLLLVMAAVATVLFAKAITPKGRATGTESTGTEIALLFLCAPRWIAMTVVLCVLLGRGQFAWISTSVLVQACVLFGTQLLSGLVCAASILVLPTRLGSVRAGLWIMGVGIPVLLTLYAGWSLAAGATPPSILLAILFVVPVAAVWCAILIIRVKTGLPGLLLHDAPQQERRAHASDSPAQSAPRPSPQTGRRVSETSTRR